MAKTIEGVLTVPEEASFALVASRFNEFITSKLVAGAIDTLVRHGADEDNISVVWVPGSFEIPKVAAMLASSDKYSAVVCLGTVIRGGTPHWQYIASEATKGIAKVALDADIPVTFGVLTTETIDQAIERAGTKAGNKGADAALAAVELLNLYAKLK